jgi:hypothetical protein
MSHDSDLHQTMRNLRVAGLLCLAAVLLLLVMVALTQTPMRAGVPDAMAAGAPLSRVHHIERGTTELPEKAGTKFDLLFGRPDLALP